MKKFLLTLFTLLWISTIACAAPAELDPKGFNGYPWGTDFQTIHKEKELKEGNSKDGMSFYYGSKESIISDKEFHTYRVTGYFFYQNQLVAIVLMSANEKEYYDSLRSLIQKPFGKLDGFDAEEKMEFHQFPTTLVFYGTQEKDQNHQGMIFFVNKSFYEKNKEKFTPPK